MFRSECAEFPNDNPELHDGAIWICTSTQGAPIVVRPDPKVSEENVVAAHEAAVALEELRAEVATTAADWLDEPAKVAEGSMLPVPLPPEFELQEPLATVLEPLAIPIEPPDEAPSSETFSSAILSMLTVSTLPPPVEPVDDQKFTSLDEPEEDLIAAALDGAHEAVADEIAAVRDLDRVAPLASGFFPVAADSRDDLPEVGAEIAAEAMADADAEFVVEELPAIEETAVETVYAAAEPAAEATVAEVAEVEMVSEEPVKVSEQLPQAPEEDAREVPNVAQFSPAPEEEVPEVSEELSGETSGEPEKVSEQLQPADPYIMLAQAMASVAIQRGRLVEAQAVQSLLLGDRVEGLSAERIQQLISAEIVGPSGRATEKISTVAKGWSNILRGENEDWAAVGASSLDEWAAEILSRFLENSPVSQLRKELREQGVAAFGLASAA